MSVSSHNEYLAKKRRDDDNLEADKRTCAAKKKADAVRSGATSKPAEPLLSLFMRLGVDEMATRRMINVEAFHDENCLVKLDDKRIESICHVNRRREAYATTYIYGSGEYNLKLAVFCMKHLKNTGRSFDPPFICKKNVFLFQAHKSSVESHDRSSIDAPVFTNRMVEKEPDRMWELLDDYLFAMQDGSGIPLAAWIRAHKKLFPKEVDDDDVSNYDTKDAELIERAPIIQESYHRQGNKALEETRARWTNLFCAGNQVLFTELHQMMGGLDIWEHARLPRSFVMDGRPTLQFHLPYLGITLFSSGLKPIRKQSTFSLTMVTNVTLILTTM